jgi:hypothetical protein
LFALFKIEKFDEVTKFRLYCAFIFSLSLGLISPVLANLKGLLPVFLISLFFIADKLAMKLNDVIDKKFNIDEIYKLGIIINLFYYISTSLYFYDKFIMILLDSIIAVIDFAIFSVYSIKLNVYLTDNYPKMMSDFQKIRNGIWADGMLIGLAITTTISYFFGNDVIVVLFLIIFTYYMFILIKNFNFYKKLGLDKKY